MHTDVHRIYYSGRQWWRQARFTSQEMWTSVVCINNCIILTSKGWLSQPVQVQYIKIRIKIGWFIDHPLKTSRESSIGLQNGKVTWYRRQRRHTSASQMLQYSNCSPELSLMESSFLQQTNGRHNHWAQKFWSGLEVSLLIVITVCEFLSDSSCERSTPASLLATDFSLAFNAACLALAERLDWCTPGSAGSHPAHLTYKMKTASTCMSGTN